MKNNINYLLDRRALFLSHSSVILNILSYVYLGCPENIWRISHIFYKNRGVYLFNRMKRLRLRQWPVGGKDFWPLAQAGFIQQIAWV